MVRATNTVKCRKCFTFTSRFAPNAILNSFLASFEKTLWKVCLKSDVLNESPITMWPLQTMTSKSLKSAAKRTWCENVCGAQKSADCGGGFGWVLWIPCEVADVFHLVQPSLVQSAGVDVNAVSIERSPVRQTFVVLYAKGASGFCWRKMAQFFCFCTLRAQDPIKQV